MATRPHRRIGPGPRGLLEFFADPTSPRHKEALDPARRAIVVCASGARASLAALTLRTWATRTSPFSTAGSRVDRRRPADQRARVLGDLSALS